MENNKSKLWEKGIIISLILIVLQLVFHFTGQEQNPAWGWVGMALFLAAIIYMTVAYSKEQNGQLTFGNLFAYGFKIAAISTLILIIWAVLMYKVIFPEMQDQMMQVQREAALKRGMSEEEMKQGMEIFQKYATPLLIGGTMLTYAIMGVIGALLGAAFSKRVPANSSPFQQ